MNTDAPPTPEILTHAFHRFRPSDRRQLKTAFFSENGERVFIEALSIYLDTWAAADWCDEHEISRIARWAQEHLPIGTILKIGDLITEKRSSASTPNAVRTYEAMSITTG